MLCESLNVGDGELWGFPNRSAWTDQGLREVDIALSLNTKTHWDQRNILLYLEADNHVIWLIRHLFKHSQQFCDVAMLPSMEPR
jgi:hypothetical protein